MVFSLVSAVILTAIGAVAGPDRAVQPVFENPAEAMPQGRIDELVFVRLKQSGIGPVHLCSDGVFVRRVYLDVLGTLPTAQEAKDFLLSKDPNKRRDLIDRLLDRDERADYSAMKWSDLLRIKAEFPINLWPNAAQAYHRWIRTAIKENWPYDRFVREMLTASGSNFRDPPVNFYRAIQSKEPQAIAQAVALTFMGARASQWPKDRLAGMAVFFDPHKAAPAGQSATALFPDGTPARLAPDRDPRTVFADWLIDAKNPWFTRNIANRVWSWLLGRGIIQEPDDARPDNPPSHPELLAFLEKELIASHYDLKRLYRLILNSSTYQLSSIPGPNDSPTGVLFGHYPLRRLEAEVLIDAVNQVTGTTEKYSSAIPEPFTFIPENQRSISLADGSISSSFLEMFGRSSRDTGLESERNNRPTASQRLHLLNSSHIQGKIEQSPKFRQLIQSAARPRDIIIGLYLTVLSRFPTEDELKIAGAYSQAGPAKGRDVLVDLAWALINSSEFLYRH